MDAKQLDAPLSNMQRLEVVEERSSSTYNLDVDALNRLIEFGRHNNPRLKGASEARLAELCEVSETTFKSIRKGRNKKPRVDILYSIVALFGGSIDRLVGLAPTRDIRHEGAVWDATLVDGYQHRIDQLEKQIADNGSELDRLRKLVLAERTSRTAAESKAQQLEEHCAQISAELSIAHDLQRKSRRINITLTALIICALIAYIIFELVYIDYGLTGLLRRLMSKV